MISQQLTVFGVSLLYGIFSGALYGILRILRKVLVHRDIFVHMEDILYCLAQSVGVFCITNYFNYGIIRMYIIMGIMLGAVFYFVHIGKYTERVTTYILSKVLYFLVFFIKKILSPGKLIASFCLKSLKKIKRTVRIVRRHQ